MAENVREFDDSNFQSEVLESSLPVMVDFWAPWCGPCKMLSPVIESLASQYDGRVMVCKMNIDESPQAATALGVSVLPTVVLLKDGQPVQKLIGVPPLEKLASEVDEMLNPPAEG